MAKHIYGNSSGYDIASLAQSQSGASQDQETFLAHSYDKNTPKIDKKCLNYFHC